MASVAASSSLCSTCSSIQFEELQKMDVCEVSILHHATYNPDGNCTLCCLFAKSLDISGPLPTRISYMHVEGSRFSDFDGYVLKVSAPSYVASGWFVLEFTGDSSFPEHATYHNLPVREIDWSVVKQWLECCTAEHNDTCKEDTELDLNGLYVIDCLTRKIVKAPEDCKYATLSYVWGQDARPRKEFVFELPADIPLQIEDAITCTKAVDIRYLWIDQYCIDQGAEETKHMLIRNMDYIYARAALTIINATKTSNGGLPGVSSVPRMSQASVSFRGISIRLLPNTISSVKRSRWSTRGWTFQEGLLSHRRLVFTESQVYFQCLKMHCCELVPVQFRLRSVHDTDALTRFLGVLRMFPSLSSDFLWMEGYLRRELSYDSDILNAVSGVLSRISCHHQWGLQFQPREHDIPEDFNPNHAFLTALLWTPDGLLEGSRFMRRENFPSWSWVGWRGIARIDTALLYYNFVGVSVMLRDQTGRLWSMSEYVEKTTRTDERRFDSCISLQGWLTSLHFELHGLGRHRGKFVRARVYDSTGDDECASAILMLLEPDKYNSASHVWPVILFPQKEHIGIEGIVLKTVGANRFERLGTFHGFDDRFVTVCSGDKATFGTVKPSQRGEVRKDMRNRKHWRIECERRSIELV